MSPLFLVFLLDLDDDEFNADDDTTSTANDDRTDDDMGGDDGVDDSVDNGGGRRRQLLSTNSFVDILVFQEPSSCATSRQGCPWTDLGIGAKHKDGTSRWCCSEEALALGMCSADQKGRVIVDPKAAVDRRSVQVTSEVGFHSKIERGVIEEQESGRYVILWANCDDENGRPIHVSGVAVIKSAHGYLPGELYGFLFFYSVLTILYVVLALVYAYAMHVNEDSRIQIETWILITVVLGLVESLFKLGDVWVWNEDGRQETWIAVFGILVGVVKSGVSRCLLVMVALGWGVTRPSLGQKLKWIVIAGIVYVVVAALRDLMILIAVEDVKELSERVETDLFDIYTILSFVVAAMDVMFALLILDSLSTTMEYLEGLKQTRKLQRFLSLRCLFLFAVLFAAVWAIFAMFNSFADGILSEEDAWIVDGATQVNYFIILLGVACLWRPSPTAKDYAYHMELTASGENGVTELELSGAVPSAMDSDDEDDDDYDDGISPPGYSKSKRSSSYSDPVV